MLKALVIDDEPEVLNLYDNILTKPRFHLDQYTNGVEGYVSLSDIKYDFILCDLSMPIVTGQELLLEVRASLNAATPIIVVSGYISEPIKMLLEKLGNIYFLNKPFRRKDLLTTIEAAIQRNQIAG